MLAVASYLIRWTVLDNLCAQVAALDGSQVLLITLPVASILIQHVWVSCFSLCLNDGVPQLLGFDCFTPLTFTFIPATLAMKSNWIHLEITWASATLTKSTICTESGRKLMSSALKYLFVSDSRIDISTSDYEHPGKIRMWESSTLQPFVKFINFNF